jgi:hypothetical protein
MVESEGWRVEGIRSRTTTVGSHSRPIDFVYHSTLGLRVKKKKKKKKKFSTEALRCVRVRRSKQCLLLGPYSSPVPRCLGWS